MSRRPRVRKPKFRVGQRVVVRTTGQSIVVAQRNYQGRWFYFQGNQSVGWEETELRALNMREIGPRSNPKPVPQGVSKS